MPTVHLLTQYIWPDAAPTGLYAEQVAERLAANHEMVSLVGGRGGYRSLVRPRPSSELIYLDHYLGRRGNLRKTFVEYLSVTRAFRDYIARFVRRDDVVVVTSAPPNTVALASCIRRRGAIGIYWLQDYYPELVRGIVDYPAALRKIFRSYWDAQLSRWDKVVKIGANLGGATENAVVIRNWPTLQFEREIQPEPLTALYSGNLGFGHDIKLLIAACEKLRARGYRITMRADGGGAKLLPDWLKASPLEDDPRKLHQDLLRHEAHLIAANPKITQAIFPSKIWNSLAAGRELVCTGFAGAMAKELEASKSAPYQTHLDAWVRLIKTALYRPADLAFKIEAAAA